MRIAKIGNVSTGVLSPKYNEEVLLYAVKDSNVIRAWGLETNSDLGIFYIGDSRVNRIKENYEDKSITLLFNSSPYIKIIDLYGREKYSISQPNGLVYDSCIYKDLLYICGDMAFYHQLRDLKTNTQISQANLLTLAGTGYACAVTTNGLLGVLGIFTNRFKVIDLNNLDVISGYPSIAETISYNPVGNGDTYAAIELYNNKQFHITYYQTSTARRHKTINISEKNFVKEYNGYNGGTMNMFYDGEAFYAGISTPAIQRCDSGGVSGVDITFSGVSNAPAMFFVDRTKTYRYFANGSSLYKFAYAGTTLLNTYTLPVSVGYNGAVFMVTNMFKYAS